MNPSPYLIGYARVSKGDEQSNAAQRRALDAAGCRRVFEETASGGRWDRPRLQEMIGQLVQMGFKLYATAGTADFLEEHGFPVQFLEALQGENEQREEYSLTHALANNLIDLYINLPSNNKFRRPANYMSKGYRTRRMAVDFQTPLVTNVKIAKILIEGISRNYDFSVSKVDYQTFAEVPTAPAVLPQPQVSEPLPDVLKRSPLKGSPICYSRSWHQLSIN